MNYKKTRYTSPLNLFSAQELKNSEGIYHITKKGAAAASVSYNSEKNRFDEINLTGITPEALIDLAQLGKALYEQDNASLIKAISKM